MSSYKVYISSTYRDLESYRREVRDSLHKVPNFTVIGMEDYVAENIRPLDRCLLDVADCDIYVLILANRYGYVTGAEGLSITHQEYRKAQSLGKVILVFKADNHDGRFAADTDEPGQPSAAEKQAKLTRFKADVSTDMLSHPEGFTSEYHLALQVMESLVRNPRVDFNGVFPDERKIFCDRAIQVNHFYDLARQKQPFNVFLIQGTEDDLGRSLVERLSRYYLGIRKSTTVDYQLLNSDPRYEYFRRRLIVEVCKDFFHIDDPDQPTDPLALLTALKAKGIQSLVLDAHISVALQWQKSYDHLSRLFHELAEASRAVGGIRVYWFFVIDSPDGVQQAVTSGTWALEPAPKLTMLTKEDVKSWLRTYVVDDDSDVLSLLRLCFSDMLKPPFEFDMHTTQNMIKRFIRRFNDRRKVADQDLLDIIR